MASFTDQRVFYFPTDEFTLMQTNSRIGDLLMTVAGTSATLSMLGCEHYVFVGTKPRHKKIKCYI